MIKKVTIIDTGAGNLLSIIRAFNKCGAKVEISNKTSKIKSASSIILPGDGAFGHATKLLEKLEISQLIKDFSKTIWSSLSFKHGTISKFSPPESKKLSFPWISISSRVSTQSEEKPGHMAKTFFFPSAGKFSKALSV